MTKVAHEEHDRQQPHAGEDSQDHQLEAGKKTNTRHKSKEDNRPSNVQTP